MSYQLAYYATTNVIASVSASTTHINTVTAIATPPGTVTAVITATIVVGTAADTGSGVVSATTVVSTSITGSSWPPLTVPTVTMGVMRMSALTPQILKLDLNLKQGVDAALVFAVVDTVGQPISDPTGYVIRAQIRRTTNDTVLFEWNTTPATGQGIAVLNYTPGPPAASTVILMLTDTQTATFLFTTARWDLFLTNPIGQSACLAEGMVRVDPYITH